MHAWVLTSMTKIHVLRLEKQNGKIDHYHRHVARDSNNQTRRLTWLGNRERTQSDISFLVRQSSHRVLAGNGKQQLGTMRETRSRPRVSKKPTGRIDT